jgi:DNA-binding GntR family transcriptional regulator
VSPAKLPTRRRPAARPVAPSRTAPPELAGTAYQRIRDLIVSGQYAPGSRVVEATIAAELGMSRTPIRAAFGRLHQDGFLAVPEGTRRSEFIIAPLSTHDVEDLWRLAGAIESIALRSLDMLHPDDRAALADALTDANEGLKRLAREGGEHPVEYTELQAAFHGTSVARCGGQRLIAMYAALHPHLSRYAHAKRAMPPADFAKSIEEHEVIIAAVRGGNAATAMRAVERHWRLSSERAARLIGNLIGAARGR